LFIRDSVFSENSCDGIENVGYVEVANSTFSNNQGSGINNLSGTLIVTGSTFHSNSGNDGGGIANNAGTVSVTTSTFDRNSAQQGGGIGNERGGRVSIINSTFSGNVASGVGGGVSNNGGGPILIIYSTFSGNSARQGGGVFNFNELTLGSSIVAGNVAGEGPDISGEVNSMSFNLIGNTAGASGFWASDMQNLAPLLGPLQDNGGLTQTMALLEGSPAIDAIPEDLCVWDQDDDSSTPDVPLNIDQRRTSRIGLCDIGAFESGSDEAKLAKTISVVNGVPISVGEFQDRVRFSRWDYAKRIRNGYESGDATEDEFRSIAGIIISESYSQSQLAILETEELLEQGAKERGLIVDDLSLNQAIREYVAEITGTEQIDTVGDKEVEQLYQEAEKQAGVGQEAIQKDVYYGVLFDMLLEDIGKEVPTEELQVNVQHILIAFDPATPASQPPVTPTDEQRATALEKANDVITALQNGESFADLAIAMSDDTGNAAQGGNLGWSSPDKYPTSFADAVKTAPIGEIIGPIETEYGYHIIRVNGREIRPLTESELRSRRQEAFYAWLEDKRDEAQIEEIPGWTDFVPISPTYDELLGDVLPQTYWVD
jgi:parvulin-like peptidyl-prolyl isomerase